MQKRRRSKYLKVQSKRYASKRLRAHMILRLLADPPDVDWFRNHRGFFASERKRIVDHPTNTGYRKHSIMGYASRRSLVRELLIALDTATAWEQRCDILRILTWRESVYAVPHVATYMGNLMTQTRICAARMIQNIALTQKGRVDPLLATMANLGLTPERIADMQAGRMVGDG